MHGDVLYSHVHGVIGNEVRLEVSQVSHIKLISLVSPRLSGPSNLECLASGHWSGPIPRCRGECGNVAC